MVAGSINVIGTVLNILTPCSTSQKRLYTFSQVLCRVAPDLFRFEKVQPYSTICQTLVLQYVRKFNTIRIEHYALPHTCMFGGRFLHLFSRSSELKLLSMPRIWFGTGAGKSPPRNPKPN